MFLIAIIAFIIIIYIALNFKIVNQQNVLVIERLGKYHRQLSAGFHVTVPFIDKVVRKVDLREHVHDFNPQSVITKDNVVMSIDSVIYCKVKDVYKNVYGISNPIEAIDKITSTTLRSIVGEMTLDQLLTARDEINAKMLAIIDEATDPWGIDITRVEIQNITPPQDVQTAMEKEMRAEREKRAMILEAEGKKEALMTEATAKAEAIKIVADAEVAAIEKVNNVKPSEEYLKMEAIKAYKETMKQGDKIIIPTDITSIVSNIIKK